MTMTTEEIIREYREAKDRVKQVGILAEQNCCTKRAIAELLRENGEDVDGRFFRGEAKAPEKENAIGKRSQPLTAGALIDALALLPVSAVVAFGGKTVTGVTITGTPKPGGGIEWTMRLET